MHTQPFLIWCVTLSNFPFYFLTLTKSDRFVPTQYRMEIWVYHHLGRWKIINQHSPNMQNVCQGTQTVFWSTWSEHLIMSFVYWTMHTSRYGSELLFGLSPVITSAQTKRIRAACWSPVNKTQCAALVDVPQISNCWELLLPYRTKQSTSTGNRGITSNNKKLIQWFIRTAVWTTLEKRIIERSGVHGHMSFRQKDVRPWRLFSKKKKSKLSTINQNSLFIQKPKI